MLSQQRFRSEENNIFTEQVNKIALSANDEKKIQLINSIWNKQKAVHKNEEIKFSNIIKEFKID